MPKTRESTIAHPVGARGSRPTAVGARERLLAEMPVRERRLLLAGVSTAVLEGGQERE